MPLGPRKRPAGRRGAGMLTEGKSLTGCKRQPSATARVATLTTSRMEAGQLLNQRSGSVFMTGR
jgi:hypothetical protein